MSSDSEKTNRIINQNADTGATSAIIRKLRSENETLRREKEEIESKYSEQINVIQKKLRDEKELREEIENKLKLAEETVNKEKNEKMEVKIQLQNEKEIEAKLCEKESQRLILEQKLKYEQEYKQEASDRANRNEKDKKKEKERRKLAEDECERMRIQNDRFRNDVERMKNELDEEMNLASEFETKYLAGVEENQRIKQ
ncbi:MAG: hypothetical protein EZS28_020614, partial [Streblomastix strix]